MAQAPSSIHALPNFRAARLVGIFNILVGGEILLCGLFLGLWVVTFPLLGQTLERVETQIDARAEAAKKAELQALDEQAEHARTQDERDALDARRKEIESRPKPSVSGAMDANILLMRDRTLITWSWVEVVSGIVLNLALLASGVGLLHWKPWARTLGVWTSAAKIVRLLVLYGVFILVIVPPISKTIGEAVGVMMSRQPAMMAPGGGGMTTAFFVRMYTITYSVMGAGLMIIGSIYPVVVIGLLTRPGIKAACSGRFQPPREPNQPC